MSVIRDRKDVISTVKVCMCRYKGINMYTGDHEWEMFPGTTRSCLLLQTHEKITFYGRTHEATFNKPLGRELKVGDIVLCTLYFNYHVGCPVKESDIIRYLD